MRCEECRHDLVATSMPYSSKKYRNENMVFYDTAVYRCCNCGEIYLTEEAEEKVKKAMDKIDSLLGPVGKTQS